MRTDEAEIRALLENWAKAVRAKDPLEARGIDSYRKTWDVFFSWSDDLSRIDHQWRDRQSPSSGKSSVALNARAGEVAPSTRSIPGRVLH